MKFRRPLDTERECVSLARSTGVTDETADGLLPRHVLESVQRHSNISSHYGDFFAQCKPRGTGQNSLTISVGHMALPEDRGDTEQRTLVLNNMEQCQSKNEIYTGEYFTLLVTHSEPGRTNSYVGYTGNPLYEVYRYNAKHSADKHQGGWMVDMVIGPHSCKQAAMDCGLSWVTLTRGKEPKRDKGPWLSAAYNRPIYTFTKEPAQSLEHLLRDYGDPEFLQLHKEMCV